MANTTLDSFDLTTQFAPGVVANDPRFSGLLSAFAVPYQNFINQFSNLLIKPRVDTLPEDLLDELAVEFGPPGYDRSFSPDLKRRMIKTACFDNAHLGTPDSVQKLVSLVFGHAVVEEWWQYGGLPYRFRIKTTDPLIHPSRITTLNNAIMATKPVSRWPDPITRPRTVAPATLYMGTALFRIRKRRLTAYA
jgi:phage tail P2-like protein